MPFVAFKCCDTDQEEFIFPDEVDNRKTTNGLFNVQCDKCGQLHLSKPLMNMSLGRLPASYDGKTVKEVDKEYEHLEGVRHLERGTLEHKRHLESLQEDGERRAREAGYRDRKHLRRSVRERKANNASAGGR